MASFAGKLSREPLFEEYFSQNIMMKELIITLVLNFFHVSTNVVDMTKDQMNLETFGLKLTFD